MAERWKSVSEPYWDNGQIKIDCVAQDLPPSNDTPRYYARLYCKDLHITSKKLLDEDGGIIKPERSCTLKLTEAAVEAWCSPLPFDAQIELQAYWTVKDSVTRTIPEREPIATFTVNAQSDAYTILSGILYWYEGLDKWEQFIPPELTLPVGKNVYFSIYWLNVSSETIRGHVELSITKPDGTTIELTSTLGQDEEAAPNNGRGVRFSPIYLDQEGSYILNITTSKLIVAHDTSLTIAITDEAGNPITESVVGETVYIAGQLKDIVDNVALQGALITLYKNGVATANTDITNSSGIYSIPYTITKADAGLLKFKTYFTGT